MIQQRNLSLVFLGCLLIAFSSQMTIERRILTQSRLLATETDEQIRQQVEAKISQKQAVISNRDVILSNLTNAGANLTSLKLNLLDAKFAVEAAYRNYFNAKQSCDGLNAQLNIVGSLSAVATDQCLEFPINSNASNLYVQKLQLQGYVQDALIAQKAFEIQTAFSSDASAELAIYNNLKAFFTSKNNANLTQKYSIQAFNSQNRLYQQNQKTSLSQQIFNSANSTKTQGAAAVQQSQNSLATQKSQCATNVNNLKTTLNQKLAAVAGLKSQIATLQTSINNYFTQLAAVLVQLKGFTADLNSLADQYAVWASTQ